MAESGTESGTGALVDPVTLLRNTNFSLPGSYPFNHAFMPLCGGSGSQWVEGLEGREEQGSGQCGIGRMHIDFFDPYMGSPFNAYEISDFYSL
ncbi:hypothetical protein MMC25_008047 [Agyrium rufum]|nr:hypothetical protein [Agyrium rufum]